MTSFCASTHFWCRMTMEMMQRWWRWKFGFSNPSSQSEAEQWWNNNGDEYLAIPLVSWEHEGWWNNDRDEALAISLLCWGTVQWWYSDGDESLTIPLSQLRNGTKAGADDAAAGSKVHSFDFDLCCSDWFWFLLLWNCKDEILTPTCLIYSVEKWFKIDKICHFSPGKN